MDTPEQKLADIESKARFKILIVCIVAAAACFLEFILVVTLPIQAGYDTFLSFSQGKQRMSRFSFFFFFSFLRSRYMNCRSNGGSEPRVSVWSCDLCQPHWTHRVSAADFYQHGQIREAAVSLRARTDSVGHDADNLFRVVGSGDRVV